METSSEPLVRRPPLSSTEADTEAVDEPVDAVEETALSSLPPRRLLSSYETEAADTVEASSEPPVLRPPLSSADTETEEVAAVETP